jgi:hypothetical protein
LNNDAENSEDNTLENADEIIVNKWNERRNAP